MSMTRHNRGSAAHQALRSEQSRRPGAARLLRRQVHYDRLIMRRNAQVQVFTLLMPLLFLVLFVAMFGNDTTDVDGVAIPQSTYYVPAIMTFAVVDAAFMTLLVAVVTQREMGILKRRMLTPEPSWVVIVGRALAAVYGALLLVAAIWIFGWLAYGVSLPADRVPATVVTVALGALMFCCLAYAVSPFVRSIEAALPVAAALAFPLVFVSGIFVPWEVVPGELQFVARLFPIRPLTHALVHAFHPAAPGSGLVGRDLLALVGWGVAGLVVARRWFRWLPRAGSTAP